MTGKKISSMPNPEETTPSTTEMHPIKINLGDPSPSEDDDDPDNGDKRDGIEDNILKHRPGGDPSEMKRRAVQFDNREIQGALEKARNVARKLKD